MPAKAQAVLQVWIACPTRTVARRIADALLDDRLCACAQTLGPIESRYTWKGKRETASEWLLVVKTRRAVYARVEKAVVRLHPYDMPEILAMPIERGNPDYLAWLARATPKPKVGRRPA